MCNFSGKWCLKLQTNIMQKEREMWWIAAKCGFMLAKMVLKVSEDTANGEGQHKLGCCFDTLSSAFKNGLRPSVLPAVVRILFFFVLREKNKELFAVTYFSRRQTEITRVLFFFHYLSHFPSSLNQIKAEVRFFKILLYDSSLVDLFCLAFLLLLLAVQSAFTCNIFWHFSSAFFYVELLHKQ